MSHTVRRKQTHNAHKRGRPNFPNVRKRPPAVRAAGKAAQTYHAEMVTDHALLRWLERVVGIDVRARFNRDLLPPDRAELIANMQTGKLRVHGTDVVLVVIDGRIITVKVEGATA